MSAIDAETLRRSLMDGFIDHARHIEYKTTRLEDRVAHLESAVLMPKRDAAAVTAANQSAHDKSTVAAAAAWDAAASEAGLRPTTALADAPNAPDLKAEANKIVDEVHAEQLAWQALGNDERWNAITEGHFVLMAKIRLLEMIRTEGDARLAKRIAALEGAVAAQIAGGDKTVNFADSYAGTWKAGEMYGRGCFATHSGGLWICLAGTADKPGTSDAWQLCVKAPRRA